MPTADSLKLDQQLCFPLYAATRAMMQAYQPLLDRLGLTYPQYLVLLVLWERDGISVKRIGERLYLDSGTLTPLLKRLEDARLVKRVRSQKDGRVVDISLTTHGRALRRRAQAVPEALRCKLGRSGKELDRARALLRSLFVELRSVNEEERAAIRARRRAGQVRR